MRTRAGSAVMVTVGAGTARTGTAGKTGKVVFALVGFVVFTVEAWGLIVPEFLFVAPVPVPVLEAAAGGVAGATGAAPAVYPRAVQMLS